MFFEVDEANIFIFLGTIKPGLLSKEEDCALWTCRILAKISFDLANMDLLANAYEWFCRENGGLSASVMCI